MPKHIRVKDKATGHEYSVLERQFNADAHTRLDKSAYSAGGEIAPPKFKTTVAKAAADKSGQKADTEKEKS